MKNVHIKQADITELDQLSELFDGYRQFYGKQSDIKLAREFLLNRFNHNQSIIFIAYKDEKAVGFTQLYPSFSSVLLARTYILNDLFVIAEARGNSIATYLLESAIAYAKTTGAARVTLSTEKTNTAAQSLYVTRGWKKDEQFFVYHCVL